jgi:1-acyl-sn-glycerol-3-phosphate acyltransferase
MRAAGTAPGVITYGIDEDRAQQLDGPIAFLRRRFGGRYPIDPFGGDAQLIDLLARVVAAGVRVRVDHAERLPRLGGALLVANRGFGVLEPAALAIGVRNAVGRRLRVIGAPEVPLVGGFLRKLGAVGYRPDDIGSLLRAGHLAAAPLAPTWLRTGAGPPPRVLFAETLGFPIIPTSIVAGGPLGLPLRPWRVIVGDPVELRTPARRGDSLAAAELAERVRDAVQRLLLRER